MVSPSAVWNPEHEETLRAFVAAGVGSHSEIAKKLNEQFGSSYSRNAIIGKVSRLGLQSMSIRPKVKKAVKEIKSRTRAPRFIAPKPTEAQIAVFRCAEVVPKNVAITDLSKDGCRWPYGDGPFLFCDHPKFGESSYCGPHFALSIGPGTSSEQAAVKIPQEAR